MAYKNSFTNQEKHVYTKTNDDVVGYALHFCYAILIMKLSITLVQSKQNFMFNIFFEIHVFIFIFTVLGNSLSFGQAMISGNLLCL